MILRSGILLRDRYRIEGLLGRGGMGAVYKAVDTRLGCTVAIKQVLIASSDNAADDGEADRQRERFENEARILASLDHPGLPRVLDHFFLPGEGQFLVMEHMEGENLASILKRRGALSQDEARHLLVSVCDVVEYLHGMKPHPILHRDIKPSNIFLTLEGRIKLVDFGLARGGTLDRTMVGQQALSSGYSPVEQIGGDRTTDERSDVYSLGSTLYALLTGKAPTIVTERLADPVDGIFDLKLPGVSPEIRNVIRTATKIEAKERFQSVRELKEALEGIRFEREDLVIAPTEPLTTGMSEVGTATLSARKPPRSLATMPETTATVENRDVDWVRPTNSTTPRDFPRGFWLRLGGALRGFFQWSKRLDFVCCSIFSPGSILSGSSILVQVFLHVVKETYRAAEMARQADSETSPRGIRRLGLSVTKGTRLQFILRATGLDVSEPVQDLVWSGHTESVQFQITAQGAVTGPVVATVLVMKEGIPLGTIRFALQVLPEERRSGREEARPTGVARRFGELFVSYAQTDRAKVLARVQALRAVGIKVFQDLLSLNPGERWEKELYRRIETCDGFLLFWSSAAKSSEWVEREWRYALQTRGDEVIVPIPIEGPPVPEPPEELKQLHFNDRLLYFMAS